MAGFYEASLAIERDRKMEEMARIVDQSPNLSAVEILRLAARSGLVDNPNMSAILKQKIDEEQQQSQLQQQQGAVNRRSDLFGQPTPEPQEQAQEDISQALGVQPPPSLTDKLGGGTYQGIQQRDFALPTPEQPINIMSRLQVPEPVPTDIPDRRREALDAGISGAELDQMLADMKSGTTGVADFDEKITRAQTARTKKKEAVQKAEALRLKDTGERLRKAQEDFVIYDKENGLPAESVDYSNPDAYVVSQERRKPQTSVHISKQIGGRGSQGAQSSKLLNNLIKEKTKLIREQNKLRTKMDLDPKVLEIEGLDKTKVEKQFQQLTQEVRDITDNINNLQNTVPITKAKQDVELKEGKKQPKSRQEYIDDLIGKVPRHKLHAFLTAKGMEGLPEFTGRGIR